MNIINRFFLNIALLPSPVFKKFGIDVPQLKAILETKLTMDDRRPSALFQGQKKKDKPIKAATVGTIIFSGIMGVFFLFAFLFNNNYFTSLTIYFSLMFIMLSATLISDFTSVLIDIRDSFIILPKPVSDRTFVTARLLHIFIHICKILVPMSVPGLIYMLSHTGIIGGVLFWLLAGLVAIFSIFFINAVYILILKITTPQRFQSIISYIQIVFAILIYGSYQVIPRMMGRMGLEELDIDTVNGIVLFPLYWFASAWSVLYNLSGTSSQWIAAVFGLTAPFFSLYVVIKYLAPSFNNKLAMINNSEPQKKETGKKIEFRKKRSYAEMLSGWVTRSAAEKMAFQISWKISSRSREYKLKVYPSIGYLIVYAVIILWNNADDGFENLTEPGMLSRGVVISSLYFTSLILTMALNQMSFSNKYKASWIYYTAPVAKPGEIILGGAKAIAMKFYFPIMVILTILLIYLLGITAIPHLILGFSNVFLITTLISLSGSKFFPFSRSENTSSNTGNFMRSMFMLMVAGFLGVLHYLVFNIIAVLIIFILMSIAALWMLMENIRNTSWAAIKSRYAED